MWSRSYGALPISGKRKREREQSRQTPTIAMIKKQAIKHLKSLARFQKILEDIDLMPYSYTYTNQHQSLINLIKQH